MLDALVENVGVEIKSLISRQNFMERDVGAI